MPVTRAGMVAVVGAPNVGKSTLLNRMIGQKLSITSDKPQSTRDRVTGIRTDATTQMVFLDTPGLLNPGYALQHAMQRAAISALNDADVIIQMADARQGLPDPLHLLAGLQRAPRAPIVIALNKVDALGAAQLTQLAPIAHDAELISALTGEGIPALLLRVESLLPESPFLYPIEEVSTQSMRFFASELVRETALEQLAEELPYSIACEVEEFREGRSPIYIRAIIYVERESQKRIVIGQKGTRIREIGSAARRKIELLVGAPVYLDLHVKVLHNWRRDASLLERLGYSTKPTQTR